MQSESRAEAAVLTWAAGAVDVLNVFGHFGRLEEKGEGGGGGQ